MLIKLRGGISLSSKMIGKLEGVLDKEIVQRCVLEVLNLTKFYLILYFIFYIIFYLILGYVGTVATSCI